MSNMTFEDSLKELQEIVLKLEEGGLSLEESLELYKKGVELSTKCKSELENAKLKVLELSNGLEG